MIQHDTLPILKYPCILGLQSFPLSVISNYFQIGELIDQASPSPTHAQPKLGLSWALVLVLRPSSDILFRII